MTDQPRSDLRDAQQMAKTLLATRLADAIQWPGGEAGAEKSITKLLLEYSMEDSPHAYLSGQRENGGVIIDVDPMKADIRHFLDIVACGELSDPFIREATRNAARGGRREIRIRPPGKGVMMRMCSGLT